MKGAPSTSGLSAKRSSRWVSGTTSRSSSAIRVAAEGQRARGLADVEADARLEPLAVGIDQRHQRDRRAKGGGGDAGEAVETVFLGRVEHAQRVQGLDALFFCEFLLTEHESSLPPSGQQMNRQHPAGGSVAMKATSASQGKDSSGFQPNCAVYPL
jgi:hypothetical protein